MCVTEKELIDLWNRARTHLVVAQFAPTFLLITTVGLVPSIVAAGPAVAIAAWGILLASGILGALDVQPAMGEDSRVLPVEIGECFGAKRHSRTLPRAY